MISKQMTVLFIVFMIAFAFIVVGGSRFNKTFEIKEGKELFLNSPVYGEGTTINVYFDPSTIGSENFFMFIYPKIKGKAQFYLKCISKEQKTFLVCNAFECADSEKKSIEVMNKLLKNKGDWLYVSKAEAEENIKRFVEKEGINYEECIAKKSIVKKKIEGYLSELNTYNIKNLPAFLVIVKEGEDKVKLYQEKLNANSVYSVEDYYIIVVEGNRPLVNFNAFFNA